MCILHMHRPMHKIPCVSLCVFLTMAGSSPVRVTADPGEGFQQPGGSELQQDRGRTVLLPTAPPAQSRHQDRRV